VSPTTGDDREEIDSDLKENAVEIPGPPLDREGCALCKGGYKPRNCFHRGPGGHSKECSWIKALNTPCFSFY
jgi:hypothetical protein